MSRVQVGRITRPHGIRGEVRVELYNKASDLLESVRQVFAEQSTGGRDLKIESVRPGTKAWLVKFSGVDDRSAAEALRGAALIVDREVLPELDSDEIYLADLLGAEVFGPAGYVGKVVELRTHPSVDCAVIEMADGGRVEQVLAEPWISVLDATAKRIELTSLDGLIQA